MATLLLLLLLILSLRSVPALHLSNTCSTDTSLNAGEVQTIVTNTNGLNSERTRMATPLHVYPYQDFQGVSLEMVDGNDALHKAWFPVPRNDTCWQPGNGWRKLTGEVVVSEGKTNLHDINFYLSIGGCVVGCTRKDVIETPKVRSLSVVGHGSSNWTSNCTVHEAKETNLPRLSLCTEPPNPATITITTPNTTPTPSSPSNASSQTPAGPSGTVVGVVVGVVVVVTVVVTVVMVCWVWKRRWPASSDKIKWRLQPAPLQRPRLSQPLDSHEGGAAPNAADRGSLHVSENSLYEPFREAKERQ